jgi:hypothetical protein
MISSIFDAFDRSSLNRWIGVGQIFYRVFGGFCLVRQTERARRLARALGSNLARIFSKIVRLGFEVAGQFGRAFVEGLLIFAGYSASYIPVINRITSL